MDANEFITNLKADNTAKNCSDIVKVFEEYKAILGQISPKDRAPFSLNVLCILCRNLDKAPKWRDSIDNNALLTLSIDCVRETRAMERADRVKTLACIYHIHRHVVKQNSPLPPELVLKISFMPFEVDSKHLLKEYSKTYWNILVDRLSYIEQLRFKIPIIKLLPKLTEDSLKIIEIYDTVQFCSNIIVFLVKKLHFLFTEKHAKELNQTFRQIFAQLSTKDMKPFKSLTDKEVMDVYAKLNDCLYIVAENASKTAFKDSPLDNVVRTFISIVGHCPDLFHCLQTFYSNSFCSMLTTNTNLSYSETVLNGLLLSLEMTEKLGYGKAMIVTYPFLNQFLRLYIEFNVNNCTKKPWKDHFNVQMQELCLKLIQKLMKRLRNCNQLLKCDNCHVKTGLHDSLRLSFLTKHFITVSLSQNILITELQPLLLDIIYDQYTILTELNSLGCVNYDKCFRKLQTDLHNTAISLNKSKYYEFSIKLFDVYLKYEIGQREMEQKNISRALYNKSICELDSKLFERAVIDAYLSLVFSSDGLSSEKYMSLVMDIKAKELKAKADDEDETKTEDLQLISVLDACKKALEVKLYGDIRPFLMDLKFSVLLKHEFAMYAKLWPSVTPIGGVWKSLFDLAEGKYEFTAENAEAMAALYEVVVETPSVVRAISGEHFNDVVTDLLKRFDEKSLTTDLTIIHASLLFLKTEYELAAASQKYGWKCTEPLQTLDPDQIPANRTIPQEHTASKPAVHAVRILTEISPNFTVLNITCLRHSLHIYQVFVQLLIYLAREMEALQLAYICCLIAERVGDDSAYVRNAGTLLYHGTASEALQRIFTLACEKCKGLPEDMSILFICDASIYFSRCGSVGVAAKLVQLAQCRVLAAKEINPEINLELAVGRLMEAQIELCKDSGPSTLSAVNSTQRHYLSIANTGSKWIHRRLQSLTLRTHAARASLAASRAARGLRAWRRARAGAAPALPAAAAAARAALYALITDENCTDDAQIKIDNRLKHVLGLQPSNETQPYYVATEAPKLDLFTPKQEIETMLENMVFKKSQISPSLPCTEVPAFKTPDFFHHRPKCFCYACDIPVCYILACQTSGLEAAMFFRANENDIARNYFNGAIKMLHLTEERLKRVKSQWLEVYNEFVVESVVRDYLERLRRVKVGILIDLSFFELRNRDFEVVDGHLVEIHEVVQEFRSADLYVSNEIMNLMTCSAVLRRIVRKPKETGLETEFECLKLTPVKYEEPPRTPVTKLTKPPKATKIIVKEEELPKKRKVIKLNLDDGSSDEKEIKDRKKHEFKIPVPVTKHVFEAATPRPRAKPTVLITQPSEDSSTPNAKNAEFFTPKESTPDQFFTPMTSVKTYSKQKSLRRNIVKNLEQEFATPISTIETKNIPTPVSNKARVDKENAKAGSSLDVPRRSKKKEDKGSLKRATSPGKLCKEQRELPRTRRLRKPVNFSIDEDDKR